MGGAREAREKKPETAVKRRGGESIRGGGGGASEKERGTAGRENRRGGLQRAEKRPTGVFRRIAARLV